MRSERLESLARQHQDIEQKLHEMQKRPAPDAEAVKALKRKKLEIKEKMAEADKSET
jgi:hypothetical protein